MVDTLWSLILESSCAVKTQQTTRRSHVLMGRARHRSIAQINLSLPKSSIAQSYPSSCSGSERSWGLTPAVLYTESCTYYEIIWTDTERQRAHIQKPMYAARIICSVELCTYTHGPIVGVTWDAPRLPVWHRSAPVPSSRRCPVCSV